MAALVTMPQLSDTMRRGKLVAWRKKEGEAVKRGDVLAEVETDKATMELEAFDEGVLLKRFLRDGDVVPVGAALAVIGAKGEDVSGLVAEAEEKTRRARAKAEAPAAKGEAAKAGGGATAAPRRAPAPRPAAPPRPAAAPAAAPALVEPAGEAVTVRASPAARRLAADYGLPIDRIRGTGPGGRVVEEDVRRAAAEGLEFEAPPPPVRIVNRLADRTVKMDGKRKTIARRLQEAKREIPHYYLQETVRVDRVVALREAARAAGRDLSYNDLVCRATCLALMLHPDVNVTVEGETLTYHGSVDLAFAVALDDGLITPVVRSAEAMTLVSLAAAIRDLGRRARAGELAPDEYAGGTFTVSNLGMYGLENFAAVVNPPAAAILAVAGVRRAAIATADGAIRAGWTMGLTLSCDHRAIDGAVGAAFLRDLRRILESASGLV